MNLYLADWPGLAQVVQVERRRTIGGETSSETSWYITSLSRDRADASRLLHWIRSHWQIENRLHYVRDVTFGEDASRVRSDSAPEVMTVLRNTVIHLLEDVKATSKPAARRRFAAHPNEAIELISS